MHCERWSRKATKTLFNFSAIVPIPRSRSPISKRRRTVVRPGEAIEFSFAVSAARDEPLLIDYVIHFVKANGKTSPKVHKIKAIQIKNGETVVLKKRHPFRANATTFTLYPGTHTITLQINGNPFGSIDFEMKT